MAARAPSPRSRSCPCQRSICGRRRRALPPTLPKRTRVSPAIIERERICALRSTTRSRAIACWTQSRRPRQPVSVKRSVDPPSSYENSVDHPRCLSGACWAYDLKGLEEVLGGIRQGVSEEVVKLLELLVSVGKVRWSVSRGELHLV